jgi:hypothetical protein
MTRLMKRSPRINTQLQLGVGGPIWFQLTPNFSWVWASRALNPRPQHLTEVRC